MVLADQLGLDYVVLFDGRVEPNKELLLETNVRQRLVPPKQRPFTTLAQLEAAVNELRAQGSTHGAYIVHVPGHYLAVQVGRFQQAGTSASRRVAVTLGDGFNNPAMLPQRHVRAPG